MTDENNPEPRPRGRLLRRLVGPFSGVFSLAIVLFLGAWVWLTHPSTPAEWNPIVPLRVDHPTSPLTDWKLRRALATPELCRAAMPLAALTPLAPFAETSQCGIDHRVRLSKVGGARLAPLETTCAIALRLAMWEHHALQPAARDLIGAEVTGIQHFSSYSCRPIRTPQGNLNGRMSTHATGEAVDISGFSFENGRTVSLLKDWQGAADSRAFLRAAQIGACRWFRTTLGPDYNSLHRDHFHLQSRGWCTCR